MTSTAPDIASGSSAVAAPPADRRRSPRHRRETTAWLSAASGAKHGKGQNVRVKDLSLHGVGYVTDTEPHKGDSFWMVIADQSLRLSTRLRVANIRRREDGKWEVGGEFF
ncbi:MAG: PilZ domain-containing protein [Tepidisphaeraceae bacterium]